MEKSHRLAVLIDAENAQASIIGELLAEIAKFGVASVKRIYGDFTHRSVASWNSILLKHSIQPVQQFSQTTGKNASDIALIIDAMDLLHSKRFDGFCIVSSDSDFTRLASRIREEGLAVIGFGERKTPPSFVAACDKFIYTEILRPKAKPAGRAPAPVKAAPPTGALPIEILRDAVDSAADEAGWAHLGQVGQVLGNRLPDFDPRNYGFKSLGAMIEATGSFEVRRQGAAGGPQAISVRLGGKGV